MSVIKNVVVTDVYEFTDILGKGGYSYVVKGNHNKTHVDYAIKLFDKKKLSKSDHVRLRREIEINFAIAHPNIVKVHEIYESADDISLVMDLMSGGELFNRVVDETGAIPEDQARAYTGTILDVIQYLHGLGIVHRDLKPENLLFESKEAGAALKLIDFGFAKRVIGKAVLETPIGTPNYAAPEVTSEDPYSMEVDLWSVGCIVYFLLFARPPFYAKDDKEIERLVAAGRFVFPEKIPVSEEVKDLITKLLERDPKKRLTATEALKHPWFRPPLPQLPLSHSDVPQVPQSQHADGSSSEGRTSPSISPKLSLSSDEVKGLRQSMNRAVDTLRRRSDGAVNPLEATAGAALGGVALADPQQTALWKRRREKPPVDPAAAPPGPLHRKPDL